MTKIGYKAVSHLEAENLLCNVLKGKTYQEQFMIDYNLLNESLEYEKQIIDELKHHLSDFSYEDKEYFSSFLSDYESQEET